MQRLSPSPGTPRSWRGLVAAVVGLTVVAVAVYAVATRNLSSTLKVALEDREAALTMLSEREGHLNQVRADVEDLNKKVRKKEALLVKQQAVTKKLGVLLTKSQEEKDNIRNEYEVKRRPDLEECNEVVGTKDAAINAMRQERDKQQRKVDAALDEKRKAEERHSALEAKYKELQSEVETLRKFKRDTLVELEKAKNVRALDSEAYELAYRSKNRASTAQSSDA